MDRINLEFLNYLESIITARKTADPNTSYTARLMAGGLDRILKKIGEEAGEVIIAAKNGDPTEFKNEVADLVFHLMLTMNARETSWNDIITVLKTRHEK